jgi:O-antigen/teichoic acid export membrane protein
MKSAIKGARRSPLLKSIAGTAGVNSFSLVLTSIGGLLLARFLGPSLRGELVAIIAWPTFAGTMAALGLPQATCYLAAKRQDDAGAVLATATIASLVAGLVVGAIGWPLAALIGKEPVVVWGLRILFVLLPLYLIPGVWVATLQATSIRLWNISRLIQPVLYVTGIAGLAVTDRLDVRSAVYVFVSSLVVQALVSGFLVIRTVTGIGGPRKDLVSPLLGYGVKTVASTAPWLINTRFDQLLLSVSVSSALLGQYAVAVSLSMLAAPVATAFGYVAFPRIAAAKTKEESARIERVAIIGAFAAAAAVMVPLALLANWVIPFLFGSEFRGAVIPLLILAPGTILWVVNQVLADILRGHGQPFVPAIAEGIAALITVSLLLILVPRFGIRGAAFVSAIAYGAATVYLMRRLDRRRKKITAESAEEALVQDPLTTLATPEVGR